MKEMSLFKFLIVRSNFLLIKTDVAINNDRIPSIENIINKYKNGRLLYTAIIFNIDPT